MYLCICVYVWVPRCCSPRFKFARFEMWAEFLPTFSRRLKCQSSNVSFLANRARIKSSQSSLQVTVVSSLDFCRANNELPNALRETETLCDSFSTNVRAAAECTVERLLRLDAQTSTSDWLESIQLPSLAVLHLLPWATRKTSGNPSSDDRSQSAAKTFAYKLDVKRSRTSC